MSLTRVHNATKTSIMEERLVEIEIEYILYHNTVQTHLLFNHHGAEISMI